ncbi:hypothetical protein [Sediminicoccus rosea]|jgi:hypothetical protein|uniref:Uncharacterized protein n=1 Tax=Sediminicoccus rosea TaxID=1225128 RepID=A0ABZ0PCU7_9PROT|nr:hypothetical protein [Sediminicoccus rosea]WPB83454.1 hypothetical protein R9Z33_15230 [Sediminicoccus rosea]
MAQAPRPPERGKRPGPNWGSIIAYGIMIALALLALAPLYSSLL